MKRKIFEQLKSIEKKCVLCLMLMGFTAMNTGFTGQETELPAEPVEVELEETSANEPTAIAVGENGRLKISADDEAALAYAEVVEQSLGKDLSNPDEVLEPVEVVETPQGYLDYSESLNMEATAYLPTAGGGAGIPAMGIPATYGIVAVDPDVIPLGSRVYIPGYGEALAADTGGAIYGNRIDLCMEDYYQAMDFGRRNVTVFVLK